jgi:hypothetical protein
MVPFEYAPYRGTAIAQNMRTALPPDYRPDVSSGGKASGIPKNFARRRMRKNLCIQPKKFVREPSRSKRANDVDFTVSVRCAVADSI